MAETGNDILDEHRRCMRLVGEVDAWLREEASDGWSDTLHERLTVLRKALAAHFRGEERSYLFVGLPEVYPRFHDRLARLRGEHAPILEGLDEVCDHARRLAEGSADAMEPSVLSAKVRVVLAVLRRHEAEENEVLFSAHWDDLGEGD